MSHLNRYPTEDERNAPRNSTGHAFLAHLTDQEIADHIAGLDRFTLERMAGYYFPGTHIADHFLSVTEALEIANANFEVQKFPLMAVMPGETEPQAVPVPGKVAMVRTDTGHALGVAGENYGIVQNLEAFAAASVLAEDRVFDIRSVQVVNGGSRVRISGLIGASTIDQLGRGPDVLAHFGVFEAAHDGVHSVTGSLETIRLVCLNGMTARTKETSFKVRHTSRSQDRVQMAQESLLSIEQAARAEVDVFAELAQQRMSLKEFRSFAEELLDAVRGEIDEEASASKKTRRETAINELDEFFRHGAGNKGVSRYDAYNAITEWVTARKDSVKDAIEFAKRFESSTYGYNARIKTRALAMLKR